ncbi:hypothetical protein BH20BAC1_BH20BAC1_04980 [soil metagenome]
MTGVPKFYIPLLIIASFVSCSTTRNPFIKRTLHEKYGEKLTEAGLKETKMGNMWFAAAEKSLHQPQIVTLPYRETAFFPADKPSATGYLFDVRQGENIEISVSTIPHSGILYFAELWKNENGKNTFLTAMDTLKKKLSYSVKKEGRYLCRVQPELLTNVEYTITITTTPSLAFPVDSSGGPKIISFWGVSRGGGRKHEGIDIQAKFKTPAIAGADGVARVKNNNLGGKVVFIYDISTGNSLYYAHLDSQLVSNGDRVSKGDKVGLIGNTGNAINTVPHLHFGIYTNTGAIDPLAFIDPRRQIPKKVTASTENLNKWLRTLNASKAYDNADLKTQVKLNIPSGTPLLVEAASGHAYRCELPSGEIVYLNDQSVTSRPLATKKTSEEIKLFTLPDSASASMKKLPPAQSYSIIGNYQQYSLIEVDDTKGWILQ